MTFVFSEFSFILHLAHHLASLSRSFCRYSAAKSIFLLMAHWPASSANCDLLVWWWLGFGMPLTDKKSNGLRLEPCGTPVFGEAFGDKNPSTLTCITLPQKKSESHLQSFVGRSSW